MIDQLGIVLYWWLLLFFLGIIFLPICQKIFKNFFDYGYPLAKILAIAFSSWLIFLGSHLRIVPFTQGSIIATLTILAAIIIFSQRNSLPKLNSQTFKVITLEEGLFLFCLLFWAYIRALKPDISGLEKFMDFGFLKILVNSRYLPPQDMWFAGEPINYYYYGHFIAAFLTKLSNLDPAITYNLMIATLFALTVSQVFSLTANFTAKITQEKKKIIAAGLISALLIGLGSNFHTLYYSLKNGWQNYWYPDATRYIGYNPPTNDKTIHEFPAYSFVVADLHGHVSALPLVILFIGLVLTIIEEKKTSWPKTILAGFILGLTYMTNAWDLPIYLLFLGISLLIKQLAKIRTKTSFSKIIKKITPLIPILLVVISAFLITSLPFNLNFKPMSNSLGLTTSKTPIYQLLVLWGALGFWAIGFLVFLIFHRTPKPVDLFVLGLIITALALITLPEIIYVKDIYSTSFYRANTMFKFTFQAYLMLTTTIGYIIARISQELKLKTRLGFLIVSLAVVASLLIYPFYSLPGFYGSLKYTNFHGLSGDHFLAQKYPEDYQGIAWLKENSLKSAIVLEAAGDSYTDYGRVSAFSGRPTVQGWLVHQWLWRGSYDLPAQRAREVDQVYQLADINTAKAILEKYQVDYIFFGKLEREKYPDSSVGRLKLLGEPKFEMGKTIIFRVRD